MKLLLLIVVIFSHLLSNGQSSIAEISDKKIQQRVQLIRHRTDSFLTKFADGIVARRLTADFEVTYEVGEFYNNYVFLNKEEHDPNNIYELTQYYTVEDSSLKVDVRIGVYYLELNNQFAPETYRLEVGFASNDDYLRIKALNYLYKPATQKKLKQVIKEKKLGAPFVKIDVDGNRNTYFVFVKDKYKPHNYPL